MRIQEIKPLFLLLLAALLAGCLPQKTPKPAGAAVLLNASQTTNPVSTVAALPQPFNTQAVQPVWTPAPLGSIEPLEDPQTTLAITPTPTETLFRLDPPLSDWDDLICSPLKFVDLKDLPKVVSDKYNPPPMGSDARHQGTDFCYYQWKGHGILEGTPVQAVFSGSVVASEVDAYPFGNLIIVETPAHALPVEVRSVFGIEDNESLYILYAHLGSGSPYFGLGERVARCDSVGIVGNTGNADAAHLHLEMRIGLSGRVFDGFSAFRDFDTPKEKQNYQIWRSSGEFLHFDPLRLLLFEYSHGATATATPTHKIFP